MNSWVFIGLVLAGIIGSAVITYLLTRLRLERASAGRERQLAEAVAALENEKSKFEQSARGIEENARRKALDEFLADLRVEERHYVREHRVLFVHRKSLVLEERIFFRNIPISNWVEHEVPVEEGADLDAVAKTLSVFNGAAVEGGGSTGRTSKQIPFKVLPLLLLLVAGVAAAQEGPLDRYVAQKDPVYAWKLVRTIPGAGYKTHVLELTSQSWRTAKDVDRPVWKHWLTIVRPDQVRSSKALLFIGGGNNNDPAPSKPAERSVKMATETASVVADLGMVPNQPLHFTDSPEKGRSEDDLIAYSRVKHFTTKDDTWLVRLAMVKSGVRAMDAIQAFLATEDGGRTTVDQFVVAGGSKRGWTTWLVGAVDPRVVAIMPIVIDALNSEQITKHHFEAYGFFSSALNDYVNHGLFPNKVGTPEYQAVLKIEDPYNYRDRPRMRMPKFMINASGDQFFLPDGSQFYYNELPEEKHLRYVPNAKHNLAGSDAAESELAFYQAILTSTPRPRFTWKKRSDGEFVVNVADKPGEVRVWQATNPEARDFRVDTIGAAYKPTALTPEKDGSYITKVAKPDKGYSAFFVELTYPGPSGHAFKFTTEVSIVPDTLPFRWEDAAKKYAKP